MRTGRNPRPAAFAIGASGAILAGLVVVALATTGKSIAQSRETATAKAEQPARRIKGDEAGVRQLLRGMTEAYNKADADALSALFQADALLVDNEGVEINGRAAIDKHYRAAFAEGAPATISGTLKSARFPTPDVASIHGEFQLQDEARKVLARGRFSLLAARENTGWKITELRDFLVETAEEDTPREHLKDLEWMIGDWVDEGEDLKIATNVRWAEGGNFLIRTFTIQAVGFPSTNATQWIGWDPRANQVRSWMFDADGGFTEGIWTKTPDGWMIKTNGTLPDGGATSATVILDSISKHSVEVRSIDRIVDGELQPDLTKIVMARKPPSPKAAEGAPRPVDQPKSK